MADRFSFCALLCLRFFPLEKAPEGARGMVGGGGLTKEQLSHDGEGMKKQELLRSPSHDEEEGLRTKK